MNNDYLPPPPASALQDAMALIRLAMDPKQAKQVLDQLSAQTDAHEAARVAISQTGQDLESRSKAVSAKETSVSSREASVTARESASAQLAANLEALRADLQSRQAVVEEGERSLAVARNALESKVSDFNQSSQAKAADLAQREAKLAANEKDYSSRVSRLKELTG